MLRAASLAALSLLAALVVACGGGASDGDADPASAVPADAMVYAEVIVRPEGDLREDALAAAGKVLRTKDPQGKLREYLDKAMAEQEETSLDYDKDIKPWLGERAGMWFTFRSAQEEEPTATFVVDVTDSEAAMEAIRKAAKDSGDKLTKRTYNDVDYEVDGDKFGGGVVDDEFLILGFEPELKRSIDAQKGDSLADADRYKQGVDALTDDRLAHFFVDAKRIFDVFAATAPNSQELEQFKTILPWDKIPPIVGSFAADGDRLAIDIAVKGENLDQLGPVASQWGGGSSPLLQELPGDSWAALATPDYGQTLKESLNAYAGMLGGPAVKRQLQNQFGIDLEADVLDWIGDVAFFVRGETIESLDAAAVIEVADSAKATRGFNKLIGLLQSAAGIRAKPTQVEGADAAFAVTDPSIPKPLIAARSAERVVIAYGEEAARDAFAPASKFGESEVYAQAKDALGMEPAMLLSMPSVLALVDAVGGADAEFEQARPYLEAYDVIAYGTESDDDEGRLRVIAGLK
jgi:uncharacterized protein DUF3352